MLAISLARPTLFDEDLSGANLVFGSQAAVPKKKQPIKKRKRTTISCQCCARQHLACDSQRPCNRCVNAGRGDSCKDGKRKRRGRKRKNPLPESDASDENADECSSSCTSTGHNHSHSEAHSHNEDLDSVDIDEVTTSSDSSVRERSPPPSKRSKSSFFTPLMDHEDTTDTWEAATLLLAFQTVKWR
jgi:hypothetical protein